MVLCLGNEIISDDAFGPAVAERLNSNGYGGDDLEVIAASIAGFGMLDLLRDRRSVLIVDTIVTGNAEPGTLHFFEAGALTPSRNLVNSHQISLPTAIELGKQMVLSMPEDIQVLAVEAQDVTTLSEKMTAPVENAIETALTAIRNWIQSKGAS